MEYIRTGAAMLCAALIVTEIVVFIIPDGNAKKTAQTVIALGLMVCAVSIFSEKTEFSIYDEDIEYNEIPAFDEDFDNFLIDSSKNVAEDIIKTQIDEICNERFSVNTQWHSQENQIILDRIQVQISSADSSKISVIKSRINGTIGMIPEVNISEF